VVLASVFSNEHDACLIAAATKLYEAAQAFIDRFDSNGHRADTDYVADLMRTALAEARGESGQ
jgi:hypothetical protein